MRWVFAVLTGALGVAACAWWLAPAAVPPPPSRSPAASPTLTAAPAADVPDAHSPTPAPEVERTNVAGRATAADAASGPGPTLVVVAGDPARPVADAEVYFAAERLDPGVNRFEIPERFGDRTRTDRDGRVTLPGGSGRLLVAARHADRFGFAAVARSPATHRLLLQADEQVRIAVRHADGRPAAGVPLSALQTGPRRTRRIWTGVSDARGEAVVRHLQLLRERAPRNPPTLTAPNERFAVLAGVPVTPPCLREFTGRPAQTATVELHLPPTGTIRVRLLDHHGNPLLSPVRIGCAIAGTPSGQSFPLPAHLLAPTVHKPVGSDPVVLPFAPVGDRLRFYVRYPHDPRTVVLPGSPGPDRPDAVCRIDVRPDARHCVLAGRLRFADGSPVAGERVDVTLWRGDHIEAAAQVQTVGDGRFDLVLSGRGPGPWQARFFRRSRGATVAVPSLPRGQRVALGDVALAELPPLATGVVVDDRGEPIAGARVEVQRQREQGDSWQTLPHLRTETAPDGAFTIAAAVPPGTLRVFADGPGYLADALPLGPPGAELRVVLPRHGILRGRVLLPPWLPDGAVTLTVVPAEPARRRTDTRHGRVSTAGGGAFQIEPLPPGRYELRVEVHHLAQPLATVADIRVSPGVTTDARLEPLELTSSLYRYRLHARDAAGRPLPIDGPIRARLPDANGRFSTAEFRWQDGRAELITAQPEIELTFFSPGYRPLSRTFVAGDHEVHFDPLPPARVRLPGVRTLVGPTRKVRVSATPKDDTDHPDDLVGGWLDERDLVELPLVVAGRYELVLRAHATASARSPHVSVPLGTFELRPAGTEVVTVAIDAEQLAAALHELDASRK